MNLTTFLAQNLSRQRQVRLESLRRLASPAVIIAKVESEIAQLAEGRLVGIVDKADEFGNREVTGHSTGKGRGGKTWHKFETPEGPVGMWEGKWGLFLGEWTKE